MAQVVSEDPTMFNVDLTEQTVPGSLTRFFILLSFSFAEEGHPSPSQSRPRPSCVFCLWVSRGTRNIYTYFLDIEFRFRVNVVSFVRSRFAC